MIGQKPEYVTLNGRKPHDMSKVSQFCLEKKVNNFYVTVFKSYSLLNMHKSSLLAKYAKKHGFHQDVFNIRLHS